MEAQPDSNLGQLLVISADLYHKIKNILFLWHILRQQHVGGRTTLVLPSGWAFQENSVYDDQKRLRFTVSSEGKEVQFPPFRLIMKINQTNDALGIVVYSGEVPVYCTGMIVWGGSKVDLHAYKLRGYLLAKAEQWINETYGIEPTYG